MNKRPKATHEEPPESSTARPPIHRKKTNDSDRVVSLRLAPYQMERINELAYSHNIRFSEMVRRLLERTLNEIPTTGNKRPESDE